jgi:SAM-dependent methyltransferase
MSLDQVLGVTQRLNVSVEALAALAAELQIQSEGLQADPEVRRLLREVVVDLEIGVDDLARDEQQTVLSAIRAFFRQAGELMDSPSRAPGWSYDDPVILQSQGRASMVVASLLQEVAPALSGLADRLERPGARFLDVGTGVGWLAVAMCRAFPALSVVGVDTWEPALALSRSNLETVGLQDRIELRSQDAAALDDVDAYDLAWIPGPFLPREIVPVVVDRVHRALRPGGWAVLGLYASPPDPLGAVLTDLRVVRGGGHPWSLADAETELRDHGLVAVSVIPRSWQAPIELVVGQRPA